MKEIAKFQIGSKVFFGEYPDFESKDDDMLYVMTGWNIKPHVINLNRDGKDRFFIKDTHKSVLIQETLEDKIPMRIGKFLVPDYAEYIHLTIDDLKLLQPLVDTLDKDHAYEKVIYDAYLENNAFTLSDGQRLEAYNVYKESRNKK